LLVAALAAVGACGDDDALPADDDDGATEPDAAGQADAAGQPDGSPDPDTGTPDASVATTVTSVSVGFGVGCATLSTGTVRCWGANEQGQVGNGAVGADVRVPTDVGGLDDALTVECGTATCCARTSASGVQCWGWNDQGVLGANSIPAPPPDGLFNRPTPGPVLQLPTKGDNPVEMEDVSAFAIGSAHGCAIQGGEVLCWGWNAAGQGGLPMPAFLPAARPNSVTGVVSLATARNFAGEHTCAITGEGGLLCWGSNGSGRLGDGTTDSRPTAAPVAGLVDVTAVATGHFHTCAIARDADNPGVGPGVFCWGDNGFGQAVPSGANPLLEPVRVPGMDGAVAIATGEEHTCAALESGAARCWGRNNIGQLGGGTITEGPTPAALDVVGPTGEGTLTGVVQLTAGVVNTCARTAASEVYCWGESVRGQFGQGDAKVPPIVPTPVEVPVLPPI
jgi:alpha-tubulin suppressor-like RCC1 family protein